MRASADALRLSAACGGLIRSASLDDDEDAGLPLDVSGGEGVPATAMGSEGPEFPIENGPAGIGRGGKDFKTSRKPKGSASPEERISGGKTVPSRLTLSARIHRDLHGKSYGESKDVLLRYVKLAWGADTVAWPAMSRCISACDKDFAVLVTLIVQVGLTDTENPQQTLMAWVQKRRQGRTASAPATWDTSPLRGE